MKPNFEPIIDELVNTKSVHKNGIKLYSEHDFKTFPYC